MLIMNFGCGKRIMKSESDKIVNIDVDCKLGADLAVDMNKFPYKLGSQSSDKIICNMVLEHLEYPTKVMHEFYRILKKGGELEITVPHFSAIYSLSADIHIRSYGVGYFYRFEKSDFGLFDEYDPNIHWDIESPRFTSCNVLLVFPEGRLKWLSKPWSMIFSKGKGRQGLYEALFSTFYRASSIEVKYVK